jgi:GT2 family glycosyltransferase
MSAERDIDCPDLVTVTLFHNRLLLHVDAGVPLGKVKPVIRRHGHCMRLAVRGVERLSEPDHGLMIDADLAVHAAAGGRLQIWAEGYLLYDHALPSGAARLSGALDGVADYCLTGWIADLSGVRPPRGVLRVDGVDIGEIPAPMLRHAMNRHAPLSTCAGFRVALPTSCLGGATHQIEALFETLVLGPIRFRATPRFQIELASAAEVRLWFADPAQLDEPTTITLRTLAGETLHQGRTMPRGDVRDLTTRLHTGFTARPEPPLPAFEVEVCAGAGAQLHLAMLRPGDLLTSVTAMRGIARQLRQMEQRSGRELGWSRDLIGTMRDRLLSRATFPPLVHAECAQRPTPICVIVPVYRGIDETCACLGSLRDAALADDSGLGRVLIIADQPPERDMAPMLDRFVGRWGQTSFEVLTNDRNLGFVATINRGLEVAGPDADVILLNADTLVPPGFATRLQAAAYLRDDIASVTPLSNDATILSLPDRAGGNRLDPVSALALDHQLHGETVIDIPVGVGFCLFLKAAARKDVGSLSAEWQRGYCEEVDWCLRAADRGWTHGAAANVFVFHHGSVSFGAEERTRILERNHAMLERRYPEYLDMIRAFLRNDPLARLRLDVFAGQLAQAGGRVVMHFSHAMGGGTALLVEKAAALLADEDCQNLVCTMPDDEWLGCQVLHVVWRETGLALRLPPETLADLVSRLARAVPGLRVAVHSLTGVGADIHRLAERHGLPIAVYVHDFQWYCPRIVLVDHTRRYCGEPETRYCQLCVRASPIYDFGGDNALIRSDIDGWIDRNGRLLRAAGAVLVPSEDTRARLARRFGLRNLQVVPHPERVRVSGIARGPDGDAVTRIAVVGGISIQKGLDVVRDLGRLIDASGAAAAIRVIGEVEDVAALEGLMSVEVTGRYDREQLPSLLARFNPHVVFFPAVWPETYSFTLSEVWAAGFAAVAFDIGAIAERIRATGGGVVLPFETDAQTLLPRLLMARDDAAALRGREVVIGHASEALGPLLFGA